MDRRESPGRRRHAAAERGFTLIETLIVASTLAVAILGMSQLSNITSALRRTGLEKAAAARAVDRELATITASNFTQIPATFNNVGFDVILEDSGKAILHPLIGDADGKTGNVTVTAPDGDAGHEVEICVRVDWLGAHGPQHVQRTVRLSALGAGS